MLLLFNSPLLGPCLAALVQLHTLVHIGNLQLVVVQDLGQQLVQRQQFHCEAQRVVLANLAEAFQRGRPEADGLGLGVDFDDRGYLVL